MAKTPDKRPAWRTYLDHLALVQAVAASGRRKLNAKELVTALEDKGIEVSDRTVLRWFESLEDATHPLHSHICISAESGKENAQRYASRGKPLPSHLRATADPGVSLAAMQPGLVVKELSLPEAWLLLQAEKALSSLIPDSFHEEGLQDIFRAARQVLNRNPESKRLSDRIIYAPRGHRLHEAPKQTQAVRKVVETVMSAIEEGTMVSFMYRGSLRKAHPYALIYRAPKMYFRALEDHENDGNEGGKKRKEPAKIRSERKPADYLCSRMSAVETLEDTNNVPADYRVDEATVDFARAGESVRLRMLVFCHGAENMIDDLKRYKLHPAQTLREISKDVWELDIAAIRMTYQLEEWIGGRWNRVKVLEPADFYDKVNVRLAGNEH